MRNFIISIVCLGILIGAWGAFGFYSNKTIDRYEQALENSIIKAVETEQWEKAYTEFQNLSHDWHQYKKAAAFFLDTQAINDTDYSIARAKYYIKEKDASNSSGELSCLKEQLVFLHQNESITWGNIF